MINVNFGWLNDYSGSKFAPFTLADKVLLNTEHNTTESFYDYVKSLNNIINSNLTKKGNQIKELQTLMHGLIDPPELLEVTRLFVQEAYSLVDNANTKTNVGALNIPIYFEDGRPATCSGINKNSYELNLEYVPNANILVEKDSLFTITTYSYTYLDALNINIKGIAEYARRAEDCNTARYSDGARYADLAMKAYTLSHNIIFDTKGDVTGRIPIVSPDSYFDGDINISLNLKDCLHITTDGENWALAGESMDFGGVSGANVNIPSLRVDKLGRIIRGKNISWSPKIPINFIQSETSTTKFPLLTGVITDEHVNDAYYVSTTALSDGTDIGVYIEKYNGIQILMGAAWNDYAEFRNLEEPIEPGYCVASYDNGKVYKTTKKLLACDGIVSDTFGFSIGKTEKCLTPLAVSGRVLAYYEGNINDYHSGDTVCAGPHGKICKMTREEIKEYPDRIVGIVSEIPTYKTWNNTEVKNRIWIKVK